MKKLLAILLLTAVCAVSAQAQNGFINSSNRMLFSRTVVAADTGAAKLWSDTVWSDPIPVPGNMKRMYMAFCVDHTTLRSIITPQADSNFATDTFRVYMETSFDRKVWRTPYTAASDSLFLVIDSLNQASGRDTVTATTLLKGGSAYTSVLIDTTNVVFGNWLRFRVQYYRSIAAAHPLLLGNTYEKRCRVYIKPILN